MNVSDFAGYEERKVAETSGKLKPLKVLVNALSNIVLKQLHLKICGKSNLGSFKNPVFKRSEANAMLGFLTLLYK